METLLNNRYRVIKTLGGGGFGETFLAEDTQMPSSRRCVVKLLKPIHNNPQIYQLVQERFQREAAILEDLGSYQEQIPTLYAYFQSEGQFYVVQEWVEGDTLTAKFYQQGVFSESAVKDILVNLLPVLEYVHSKRIIHRDIKPDNIILRHRDGKPVLIDFGAVRESMGTVINSQGNPTSSIVIGTPGYMPSEQAAGRPVYSSDLYSLGITAIFLLTGKQPQELEADPRTGEIMWRTYALSISPTLADIIDRAIAYHPRERFVTAREMLEALQSGGFNVPATVAYQHQAPQPPTVPYQHQAPQPPTVPYQYQQAQPTVPPNPPLPNTVAASPSASPVYAPVSQKTGNQGVVIASLIAGGLVGASVLIGFALTRPHQPVSNTTTSSTQSTTPSNTSDNVEPTATPTDTPLTETDQTTTSQTTTDSTPTTPVDSETTTPETNETTAATTANTDLPTPEQAVENYYATINQGDYQTAWNLLSPSFQNNRQLHPNGYDSYVEWWGGQVQSVTVNDVGLVEGNAETATIDASLTYVMKDGKQVPASVQLSLLWDANNNRWIVNGAK